MKKIMVVAAATIMLFGLTACGSSSDTSSQSSTDTTVDTTPALTPRQQYLADAHSLNDPLIDSTSDSDLLGMSTAVCNVLDEGYTFSDMLSELISSGVMDSSNAESIGKVIGVSVRDICPEYVSDMQTYISQNS